MSQHTYIIELHKLNAAINEKTSFMLITASTASIAYILTQIKDLQWSHLIYLPIASLALLAISFVAGCSSLNCYAKFLNNNSLMIQNAGTTYEAYYRTETNKLGRRNNLLSSFQQYSFIIGAIVYACYVLYSIYSRQLNGY